MTRLKDLIPIYSRYIVIKQQKLDNLKELLNTWKDKLPDEFSTKMKALVDDDSRPPVMTTPDSFKKKYLINFGEGKCTIKTMMKTEKIDDMEIGIGDTVIVFDEPVRISEWGD